MGFIHRVLYPVLLQVLSHEQLREMLAKEKAPLMQVRATFDFQPQSEKELKLKKVRTYQTKIWQF